jgi:hypothetical protein
MTNNHFFNPFAVEEEGEEQPSLPSREALRGIAPRQERPAIVLQEFPPGLSGLMPQGDLDEPISLGVLPLEMDLPGIGIPELPANFQQFGPAIRFPPIIRSGAGRAARWQRVSGGWRDEASNFFLSELLIFGTTPEGQNIYLNPHGGLLIEGDDGGLVEYIGLVGVPKR